MSLLRMFTVLGAVALAVPAVAPNAFAGQPGVITEFPVSSGDNLGLAQGPDGNFWFTQLATDKIVRITPSGRSDEFPTPTADSDPNDITAGPDGNLWFTQRAVNKIGRITPSGTITEFPLASSGSPTFITAGPDGNLWFSKANNNSIHRMNTSGAVTGSFPMPTANTSVNDITVGPDGNLWYTGFNNRIGRVSLDGTITDFPAPGTPSGITAGPDGNVWFTEFGANKIGRITASGAVTEFVVPTASSTPSGIATGADGNLWFTQAVGNKITRITPGGTFTEYPLPNAASSPRALIAATDGALWFNENSGDRIGRITSGISPQDRLPVLSGTGQAGLPLVCGADVWGPSSTVTVRWERDGSGIAGRTGITFTPTVADIGTTIRCVSTAVLPGMVAPLSAASNGIQVVAQLTGPQGPSGTPGAAGPPGAAGQLAAVFAPGGKRVKSGKTLSVQFGVTNAASLTAQLSGKRSATKAVQATAGTNTLRWKLPKSIKPGRYALRLLFEGSSRAQTSVRVTK